MFDHQMTSEVLWLQKLFQTLRLDFDKDTLPFHSEPQSGLMSKIHQK
jgi:hypothetical protein